MSIESAAELSRFLTAAEYDQQTYDSFADAIYASASSCDDFAEQVQAYQATVEAGGGDALRLGVAHVMLGNFADALTWLSKGKEGRVRRYYSGQAALALGRYSEAVEHFQKAQAAGWDALAADMQTAIAHARAGDVAAADKLVKKHEKNNAEHASVLYVRGLLAERGNDRDGAMEFYQQAMNSDPDHVPSMFRAAWLHDMAAEDEDAVDLYKRLALQPRAHVNALINLAVLYEDRGYFDAARACLRRVLMAYPNHTRARLFYKDVESSRQMVIDDGVEQRVETRNRLLDSPVAELELSVRARNVLKKMKVQTLGELIKLSEAELLAYKNFGETTLNEIKATLTKRGLRLGQRPEEIDVSAIPAAPSVIKLAVPPGAEAILAKSVSELELSVRARRCLQRLNISTLGDLIQHSEPELMAARNFGQTSLAEIKTRLADHGLSLATRQ